MRMRNRALAALGVGALIAGSTIPDHGPAEVQAAPGGGSRVERFGMHSLGPDQTSRLTVSNPKPLSEREIIPCVRVRMVHDAYEDDGGRLRFVRRVEREEELEPGQAAALEITAGRTGDLVSAAVFVRAVERGRVEAVSTQEVREGGRTLFVLPGVRKGFDPQPDPPGGF